MMTIQSVAILSPGHMGHNVGRLLIEHGMPVLTCLEGRSTRTRLLAEKSKAELEASGRFREIVSTQIVAAGEFWPAEEYHQDYYKKNPIRYQFYRFACGRDKRLEKIWGEDAGK